MSMNFLALVTAKSNSVRVPNKNKFNLAGKPLYRWTTEFLESVELEFKDMVFSSDEPNLFVVSNIFTKLVRPKILCEDCSPHVLSVRDTLVKMETKKEIMYDYVFLFQPTNPLREKDDLYNMFSGINDARPMLGKTYYIDENIKMSYIEGALGWKEGYVDQSGSGVLIRSGSIYAYSRQYLMGVNVGNDPDAIYVCVPKYRGYNINNEEDFAIVEAFIKRYKCSTTGK